MLAGFGAAFDWTGLESDTTTGVPEEFTRMYVAPEVRLFRAGRDVCLTYCAGGR
jgi:hypothetical protein